MKILVVGKLPQQYTEVPLNPEKVNTVYNTTRTARVMDDL